MRLPSDDVIVLLIISGAIVGILFYCYSTAPLAYINGSIALLNGDLHNVTYPQPYEEAVFDCTEMSAYLWQFLNERNWNASIALGDDHAWLLVNTKDGLIPVEATIPCVIHRNSPTYQTYFNYTYLFPTLQDALNWNHDEFTYNPNP